MENTKIQHKWFHNPDDTKCSPLRERQRLMKIEFEEPLKNSEILSFGLELTFEVKFRHLDPLRQKKTLRSQFN